MFAIAMIFFQIEKSIIAVIYLIEFKNNKT